MNASEALESRDGNVSDVSNKIDLVMAARVMKKLNFRVGVSWQIKIFRKLAKLEFMI